MTTVAYKNGEMAADSRSYTGGKITAGMKQKIHRLKDGSLFGASSSKVGLCDKFRRDTEERGVEGVYDETMCQGLLVTPGGEIYIFNDGVAWSGPCRALFTAIGSGEEFAMGAMAAGATPAEAVRIACELDNWSGGEVLTMRLET